MSKAEIQKQLDALNKAYDNEDMDAAYYVQEQCDELIEFVYDLNYVQLVRALRGLLV